MNKMKELYNYREFLKTSIKKDFRGKYKKSFLGVLPVVLIGVILAVLIMLEPNMSITVCIMALMVCMLFLSGIKLKFLVYLILPLVVFAPILIIFLPCCSNGSE